MTDGGGGEISSSSNNGRTASGAITDSNIMCSKQREFFNVPATLRQGIFDANLEHNPNDVRQGPRLSGVPPSGKREPPRQGRSSDSRSSQSRGSQRRGRRGSSTGHSSSSRRSGGSSSKTRGRTSRQQSRSPRRRQCLPRQGMKTTTPPWRGAATRRAANPPTRRPRGRTPFPPAHEPTPT